MSEATIDLLTGPDFGAGLLHGVALFGLIAVAGWLTARDDREPMRIGGLALGVGALLVVAERLSVSSGLWSGALLLAVAGAVPLPRWAKAPLAIPGAWLVGFGSGIEGETWVRFFVLAMILVLAPIIADFDFYHRRRGPGLPLLTLTIIGVFFTLPDTEHALILMGVALPLAFLGWPRPFARLGDSGSFAAVGILMWVVGTDGTGRASAIVGATAALGFLVVEPIGRRAYRLATLQPGHLMLNPLTVGSLQLVVVFLTGRVAGSMPEIWQASASAITVLALAAILLPKLYEVDQPS